MYFSKQLPAFLRNVLSSSPNLSIITENTKCLSKIDYAHPVDTREIQQVPLSFTSLYCNNFSLLNSAFQILEQKT